MLLKVRIEKLKVDQSHDGGSDREIEVKKCNATKELNLLMKYETSHFLYAAISHTHFIDCLY